MSSVAPTKKNGTDKNATSVEVTPKSVLELLEEDDEFEVFIIHYF